MLHIVLGPETRDVRVEELGGGRARVHGHTERHGDLVVRGARPRGLGPREGGNIGGGRVMDRVEEGEATPLVGGGGGGKGGIRRRRGDGGDGVLCSDGDGRRRRDGLSGRAQEVGAAQGEHLLCSEQMTFWVKFEKLRITASWPN